MQEYKIMQMQKCQISKPNYVFIKCFLQTKISKNYFSLIIRISEVFSFHSPPPLNDLISVFL